MAEMRTTKNPLKPKKRKIKQEKLIQEQRQFFFSIQILTIRKLPTQHFIVNFPGTSFLLSSNLYKKKYIFNKNTYPILDSLSLWFYYSCVWVQFQSP